MIMTEPTSNLLRATAIMATNCRGVGQEPQTHGHSPPNPAKPRRPAGLPVRTEVLDDLAVVNFLRGWENNDGDVVAEFVHQRDLYASPPGKLVKGLKHAFWAINKHGKTVTAWIFGSKDGNRRDRMVKGEGGGTWHVEGGPRSIPDGADGEAYRKRFSYKKRATGKSGKPQGAGWIMMQFSLDKQDKEGADQKVISVIYSSSRREYDAEMTSTAASSQDEDMASVDVLSFPGGGDGSSPVPAAAAPMPPVSIPQASNPGGARLRPDGLIGGGSKITTAAQLLLQAAEKAVDWGDFKNACQIPELEAAKDMYLTAIHQLGLDSSIVSDPFSQLDVHLQYVAMKKNLAPDVLDDIVCLGESMSKKIFSECVHELGRTARQAFNGVERLGGNVQEALQRASKMTSLSLVVNESEAKESVQFLLAALLEAGLVSKVEEVVENERPIPPSSTATSGSGVKRKADGVHEEAPPGVRQARTGTCSTDTPEDPTDEIFSGLNGEDITPVGGGGVAHIGFADVPGLDDNPEDPAGVVAPQVEAQAQQQWPEDEMVEPPSAPCRIPDSDSDPSCWFALKNSACRSGTQQQQQEAPVLDYDGETMGGAKEVMDPAGEHGGGAGTEQQEQGGGGCGEYDRRFECTWEELFPGVDGHLDGGGGAFDLPNSSGAGGPTTGLAPNVIITFPYLDLDNIEYTPSVHK